MQFFSSFSHLVFPSKCLHCSELLPPNSSIICSFCASQLVLASLEGRCAICFRELEDESVRCSECIIAPFDYVKMASAFDYEGVPTSLVKQLKYGNRPSLAKGMAAFLVAQLDALNWPLPDALVPVPLSLAHWLERGYNQSALIAEEMAKLMDRPLWNILKRKEGDFSQAGLSFEDRKTLANSFYIKSHRYSIKGKRLIVVDDVMTSGATLQRCAEALLEEFPAALYALTFCRTN